MAEEVKETKKLTPKELREFAEKARKEGKTPEQAGKELIAKIKGEEK